MSNYNEEEKQIILKVADESIKFGLEENKILPIKLENYPEKLRENGASFVTLDINKKLRGCIGSLVAHQPLIKDIAHNAYSAAFGDSRFSPLSAKEYPKISKHISILSEPTPMSFSSEEDLLKQIRPGVDGLILSDLGHRGTFLPSVWESLPDIKMFFQHLKSKACLPQNHWSETLTVERYTVEVVE